MIDPLEVKNADEQLAALKIYGREVARTFAAIRRRGGTEPEIDFAELKKLTLAEKKDLALCELGVATRTVNSLENSKNILYIGQLLEISYLDVAAIPNCGVATIRNLLGVLRKLDLLDQWDYPD